MSSQKGLQKLIDELTEAYLIGKSNKFHGVGMGEENGEIVLRIYHSYDNPEEMPFVPDQYKGVPVVLFNSGEPELHTR